MTTLIAGGIDVLGWWVSSDADLETIIASAGGDYVEPTEDVLLNDGLAYGKPSDPIYGLLIAAPEIAEPDSSKFLDAPSIAALRAQGAGIFWDMGILLRRTEPVAQGGYSHFADQFGDYDDAHANMEIETPCKYTPNTVGETPVTQIPGASGVLLLPAALSGYVTHKDRFMLTKRFGSTEDATLTLDLVGHPMTSVLGMRVDVSLIVGGVEDAG